MLPRKLEAKIGAAVLGKRQEAIDKQQAVQCPPVSPHLLKHLEIMFSYPVDAKPGNPQLSQLLTVQYGVEKVLSYLRYQYDGQTAEARKEHGV